MLRPAQHDDLSGKERAFCHWKSLEEVEQWLILDSSKIKKDYWDPSNPNMVEEFSPDLVPSYSSSA